MIFYQNYANIIRGTQQTISVNMCAEDLLSSTIFGLKCDEKLGFSLAHIFVIWGKLFPLVFGEIKMTFWVRKKVS